MEIVLSNYIKNKLILILFSWIPLLAAVILLFSSKTENFIFSFVMMFLSSGYIVAFITRELR